MLYWAAIFFVISVFLGFFSFTGVVEGAADVTRTLFYVALLVFLITLILGLLTGRRVLK